MGGGETSCVRSVSIRQRLWLGGWLGKPRFDECVGGFGKKVEIPFVGG
jgi:hypothetical protein